MQQSRSEPTTCHDTKGKLAFQRRHRQVGPVRNALWRNGEYSDILRTVDDNDYGVIHDTSTVIVDDAVD